VQIISTEEGSERGLRMGAMGVLPKPVQTKEALDQTFANLRQALEPRVKGVLIVEQDDGRRNEVAELIRGDDVRVFTAASADEANKVVADETPDAVVLSLDLPDARGFDLIDELRERPELANLPVIIHVTRDLTKKEETHLKRLCQTSMVKVVRSPERVLDETCLFLHRPLANLPPDRQDIVRRLHNAGTVLTGKKVLIVDDDIRNIFAMTTILEEQKMQTLSAETGKSAIEILQEHPDTDVVLMDIMMPDMDGYDTMRAVRKMAKFRSLPMIALTAKAMKGDREKCIEAGASDYIAKPVDTQQLLSLLRVWLYR
jgi:CheY-like chemotaxis protein